MSAELPKWRDAVRQIAWRIGLDDYPTGSLAALRRLGDAGRFDWSDTFDLLFWRDGEAIRRRIARDYYRQQYSLQKAEENAA